VAYTLTKAKLSENSERGNQFKPDPLLTRGSASNEDYKASGYDRGHLAPAADQGYSEETMKESFYLSNMSPQEPGFNRGIWKRLETRVREWSDIDSALYIVSGGVLNEGLKTIGPNRVAVPASFYKVILAYRKGNPTAIGFLMPNKKSTRDIRWYQVTVDSVEHVTGIDFFCKLPELMEQQAESTVDTTFWFHSR
jgi:endonuclease G